MNKWRRSIIYKIFLITSGLLVVVASIIYLTLYLLLPSFYYKYKINTLNEGIESLIHEVEKETLEDSIARLDDFSVKYNVEMIISDVNEQIVYLPPSFRRMIVGGIGQRRLALMLPDDRRQIFKNDSNGRTHVIENTITFAGEEYYVRVVAALQPVDEVANVIFMFTPYIIVIILFLTIIGAFFYSRIITKPLIHVNRVAKRMANLDFYEKCPIHSQDEIGELSQSLNQMSHNLQQTMTELQTANEQLKDEIQRERDLEVKRREFVATISHELKSPITAVKGQIEAMIHGIGPYKDRDKYLKRSYLIMGEMENLVKEVLEISQLEQHNFTPILGTVNVKNLVEECVEKLEYFCQTKQIELEVILDEVYIQADKKLMKKAIGNVIDNAVKYSPDGAKVIITLKQGKNRPFLRVFNSGVRMEEKDLEQIFQAFYRIEKSRNRNTGGSGLGLYIVQRILDLHQVEYDICNKEDGVEFTMIFPT